MFNPQYPTYTYNYYAQQTFLPRQPPPYPGPERWPHRNEVSEEEERHHSYFRHWRRYHDDRPRSGWRNQCSHNASDDEEGEEDDYSDNNDDDDDDDDDEEGEDDEGEEVGGYERRRRTANGSYGYGQEGDEDDEDFASVLLKKLTLSTEDEDYGPSNSKIVVIKDMHLHMRNNKIENFTWNKKVKGQYRY